MIEETHFYLMIIQVLTGRFTLQVEASVNYFQEVMVMLHSLKITKEANTKLICLVKDTIEHEENSDDATFIIRSTSGDIDILLILLNAETNSVFIDDGRGNNCKLFCIHATTLTIDEKKAIGLHTFTGTDQNSSSLRKSQIRCW